MRWAQPTSTSWRENSSNLNSVGLGEVEVAVGVGFKEIARAFKLVKLNGS
jgi:hypothetical protein